MADTGFKTAGAIVSAGTWTSFTVSQLNSSNNLRAIHVGGSTVSTGVISTFAWGIPSGATINGIEIQVEFRCDEAAGIATTRLSLSWNAGTNYTSTKSDTVTGTTDVTKTYGGSADTWGRTWSDTEFSDANFYIKVEGFTDGSSARQNNIDFIQGKVYYTPAVPTFNALLLAGD